MFRLTVLFAMVLTPAILAVSAGTVSAIEPPGCDTDNSDYNGYSQACDPQRRTTIVIEPPGAAPNAGGPQVAIKGVPEVTVTRDVAGRQPHPRLPGNLEGAAEQPWPHCLRGAIATGFNLVVHAGGSVEELAACAESRGIAALYVLHEGRYVAYIVGAPGLVNEAFAALYPEGVPALTPLVAASNGPLSADPVGEIAAPDWAACFHGAVAAGWSLVLYEGGSVEQLAACAGAHAVDAAWVLHGGEWVGWIAGAPDFVNLPFAGLYAEGLPSLTPLVVRSDGILPVAAGEWTRAAIANLATGYTGARGVWTSFDPGAHPALAVYRTPDNEFASALAINFPSPGTIGDAVPLSVAGRPFASLHYFTDLNADVKERLARITYYDFNVGLAGVDTFVMIAGGGVDFSEPSDLVWTTIFMHELFHRHQILHFKDSAAEQDVENYAYTPRNIAMATLEDLALREATTTSDASIRERAARRFAALRMARLAADERVALDNLQEWLEGSARYLEHRIGGSDTRFLHHAGNYDWGLLGDPHLSRIQGIKQYFGFGRFYASGATVLRTLDLLGATGVDVAVQDGRFPAEVLIEHLGVTQADVPQLVADARAAYDPDNTLMAAAERAAAAAAGEGPVFGRGGSEGNPLADTGWRLVALGDADTPAEVVGSDAGAEFTPAVLTGWTGCNSYGARYSVRGSDLRLDDLRWTEAGCPSQALFRQEQRMQNSLATVERFEFSGEQLTLQSAGGQVLVFERVRE